MDNTPFPFNSRGFITGDVIKEERKREITKCVFLIKKALASAFTAKSWKII